MFVKTFNIFLVSLICFMMVSCGVPGSGKSKINNWTAGELTHIMQTTGLNYVGRTNSARRTPAIRILDILSPMAVWGLANDPVSARARLAGGSFYDLRSIEGGLNPKIVLGLSVDGDMEGSYIILENDLLSGKFYAQNGEFYQNIYRF